MANWTVRYSCSLGQDSGTCVKWFVGVFAEETNRSRQLIPDAVLLECGTFQLSMARQRIGTTCWDCMVALVCDGGDGLDLALLPPLYCLSLDLRVYAHVASSFYVYCSTFTIL